MRIAIVGDIVVRDFPAMKAAIVTEQASSYLHEGVYEESHDGMHEAYDRMLRRGYEKLARWMKNGGNPTGPTFIIYPGDPMTVKPERFTMIIGYPAGHSAKGLDSVRVEEIPAMTAAVAQFSGPFSESGHVRDSLAAWMAVQGYMSAGPVMEVYLRGMMDNSQPNENFGEVRWPVRRVDGPTAPTEPAVPAIRQK